MQLAFNQRIAERAARKAAMKLAGMLQTDGRFLYRYALSGDTPKVGYNVTRHLCAAWALLTYAAAHPEEEAVRVAGEAAILGARSFMIESAGGGLCVADQDGVPLGAQGVFLIALGCAPNLWRDPEIMGAARAVGDYILAQRKPAGDFIQMRDLRTFAISKYLSPYFIPQAIWGLCSLSRATGDASWAQAAREPLDLAVRQRFGVQSRNHWVSYALEAGAHHFADERYLDLSWEIARAVTSAPAGEWKRTTCWLACNCEALGSYARMVAGAGGRACADQATHKTLRAMARKLLPHQQGDGAFVDDLAMPVVRIDFIHHAILALMAYAEGESRDLNPR